MTYGDLNTVRKLAGNPDTTDIADADITQAIGYGDARVNAETGDSTWLSTDDFYPLAKEASEYFASSWVRDRYKVTQTDGSGTMHYQKALDICDSIRKAAIGSIIIASSDYQTWPLNQKKPIYRSLPGSASTGSDTSSEISGFQP